MAKEDGTYGTKQPQRVDLDYKYATSAEEVAAAPTRIPLTLKAGSGIVCLPFQDREVAQPRREESNACFWVASFEALSKNSTRHREFKIAMYCCSLKFKYIHPIIREAQSVLGVLNNC
jgi:hypothetical protein